MVKSGDTSLVRRRRYKERLPQKGNGTASGLVNPDKKRGPKKKKRRGFAKFGSEFASAASKRRLSTPDDDAARDSVPTLVSLPRLTTIDEDSELPAASAAVGEPTSRCLSGSPPVRGTSPASTSTR